MANEALVGIVARTETVGIGVELRENRVKLAQPHDRRTLRYIRAGVARRLQLAGAVDAFIEGRELIGRNGGAGRWVRADDRRMRNRDTPILKVAGGVLRTAADAGISLRQSRRSRHA